jgi:hypothetical protein
MSSSGQGATAYRPDERHAPGHTDGHHNGGQSVGVLVSRATQQLSDLLRAELRLAVAELKDKGKHAGRGAGLFGGAGLVALYGVGVLLAAAVAALALVLPVWLSALIIGVVLMVIAGVLALMGRAQTRRAVPPTPERALDSTRKDVVEIKERAAHRTGAPDGEQRALPRPGEGEHREITENTENVENRERVQP